jgi:hypothetical protein
MRLDREAKVSVGWIEEVPLLWKFVADLGAVVMAAVACVAWTVALGQADIVMEWEVRGVTRPDLRRAYRVSLPAAW